MSKEDIKTKAECWDYYQGLLKLTGFDGITDLLTKYKQLEQLQPSSAVIVPESVAKDIAIEFLRAWNRTSGAQSSDFFDEWIVTDEARRLLSTSTPPSAEQAYKIKLRAGDYAHGSMGKEKYLLCRERFIADGCQNIDKGVFMERDYFGWRQPKNGEGFVFSSFRDDYEGRFLTFEQIMEKQEVVDQPVSAAPIYTKTFSNEEIAIVPFTKLYQLLTDTMTAAGLIRTGHRSKGLSERISEQVNCIREAMFSSSAKPQRITEQDALEILMSWGAVDPRVFQIWMSGMGGHTLLAKLNEHREPDYKAQRDALLVAMENYLNDARSKDGESVQDHIQRSFKLIAAMHESIAKVSASTEVLS